MQTSKSQPEIVDLGSDSDQFEFAHERLLSIDHVEASFDRGQNQPEPFGLRDILDPPNQLIPMVSLDTPFKICLAEVLEVFPDISHDHVQQLYNVRSVADQQAQDKTPVERISLEIITQILDGGRYPKEKDHVNELKRKRTQAIDSDEEEEIQWRNAKRELNIAIYNGEARVTLQEEFVHVPSRYIDSMLNEKGHFFATYLALELAEHTYLDSKDPPYSRLKSPRRIKSTFHSRIDQMEAQGYAVDALRREIMAAKNRRKKVETTRQVKKDIAIAEAITDEEYRNNGDVLECLCCYDSYPLHKITHCDGDEPHFFCLECAENNAKSEIGNSRHELICMAGADCTAPFSREQKLRFLDAKSFEALERIQQQADLRLAEVKNLSKCPFCDFAAICPPITVDKEFRCRNPECEKTSCRLCKLTSHLPLTCEESKKENGIDERHILEEARTEALLRTCPKCKVKILKTDGCNKVVCTCGGILCDYCGQDITAKGYSHFDGGGTGRISGGPSGKCPTYDNFHMRRNNEVAQAEAEALKKVRDANPHLKAEDLKIDFDEAVQDPPRRHPGGLARPAQPRPRGMPPLPGEYPQLGLPVPFPLEVEMRNPYAQHHAYRPLFNPRDRNTANGIENDLRWAARADRGFGNRDPGDRDYRREQRERAHRDYRHEWLREAQDEVALMERTRARYEEAHKRDENVGMHRVNDGAPQTRQGLRYGDGGERADPNGQGFQMPPTFREVRDRARWDGSRRQR